MVFQGAVSTPGQGAVMSMNGIDTLVVEIFGTSATRQVNFMARGQGGVDRPIAGVRLSDSVSAASSTTSGEMWRFNVRGVPLISFPVTAVTGGTVSVVGTVVVVD